MYKGLSIFKEAIKSGPEVVEPDLTLSVDPPVITSTESIAVVQVDESIPDPMILRLYEDSQIQVSNLTRQLASLQEEMQSSLAASKLACDRNISNYNDILNMTSSSLSRCEARIDQIELDSSHFIEKLEVDFQQNIEAIIKSKNVQISELESLVSKLQVEVKTLSIPKKPDPVQLPHPVPLKTPEKPLDRIDRDLLKSTAAIVCVSGIATLAIIVALYLYQERKQLMEANRRLSQQMDVSHLTAISSPPPVEVEAELFDSVSEEHLAMSIEDTRASILRGVTVHVREIEQQHQAEMIRLRSLLLETGDASREISLAIKGIISDTSMVSTAAHNTPGLSDILSSSSDEEDDIQFSSLSQRLESAATTPIRIETKNWLSKAKGSSQQPTACPPSSIPQPAIIESFVIGSPKLPTGNRNLMEYAVTESSDESSSEMALEQIRGNFGYTH